MKKILSFLLICLSTYSFGQVKKVQTTKIVNRPVGSKMANEQLKGSQTPFFSKLIRMEEDNTPCLSEEENVLIRQRIVAAKQRQKMRRDSLKLLGPLPEAPMAHPLFIWPMQATEKYDMQYKYFYKGHFVDQDPDTVVVADHNCGTRTYNGHDASDIGIWPFRWRMMDSMYVMAVAAADGVILDKQDGGSDQNCEVAGSPTSNWIVIKHADDSYTRYHHFKRYSLTSKLEGDTVRAGEFLGFIGSSGRSSGPHLHFAVYDANDNVIEPFYTNPNCNTFNQESWWENQPPYWDSKINRIMTHSQTPEFGKCYSEEKVYAKNNFNPGDFVYTGIGFTENQAADVAQCYVYRPDGSLFTSWLVVLTSAENSSYQIDGFTLPSGNTGTWQVRVFYRNENYYHHFSVGCTSAVTVSGTHNGTMARIGGNTISTTANHLTVAGDKVLYQASNSIEFKPGFSASSGVLLKTRLAPCTYAE